MKKMPLIYRIVSFFLAAFLALDSGSGALYASVQVSSSGSPSVTAVADTRQPFRFPDLPSELGTLESLAESSGPILVHIQTAHGHEEAQRNIGSILSYLKNTAGITTVLVEGSANELDPARLDFENKYPGRGPEIRESLLKKGWLKGPELFLLEEKSARVFGIEDQTAYVANGLSFQRVLEARQRSERYLAGLELQIQRLLAAYLPSGVREQLKQYEAWESGLLPLAEWLKILGAASVRHLGFDPADPASQLDYPMTGRLAVLLAIEQKFDMEAYKSELSAFEALLDGLPEEVSGPVRELLALPPGRTPPQSLNPGTVFERFAAALPDLGTLDKFPNVMLRVRALVLQSELNASNLSEETRRLSQKVLLAAGGEESMSILQAFEDYRLLVKLFSLEAVPAEVDSLLEREDELRPARLAERFKTLNSAGLVRDLEFTHLPEIEDLLDTALDFYRGARERDARMIRNVEKLLKERGIEKAAVVTGGFHARPFQDYFVSKGYAFARVTPFMTGPGSRDTYVRAAFDLGLKFSSSATWETPFLSDPAFLPPSLGGALSAGARAELRAAESSEELEFRYYDGPQGLNSLEKDRLEAWLEEAAHFKSRDDWIRSGENAIIAYAGGRIAGVQAYQYREEDKTLEARGLYVSPEFRRSRYHVALRLRDRLLTDFKSRGAEFFETNVSPDPGAQAFHRSWALDLGDSVSDVITRSDAPEVLLNIEIDLSKYVPNPAHQSRAELRSMEGLDYGPLTRETLRAHAAHVIEMVHTYPGDTIFDAERDTEEAGRLRFDPALSRTVTDPARGGVPAAFVFASEVNPESFSRKMPGIAVPSVKAVYLSKFRVENDIRHHGLFIEFYLRFLTEMSALGYQKVYWRVSDLPSSRSPLKIYRRWVQTGAAVELGRFPPAAGADVPEVGHLGFEGDIPLIIDSLHQLADYLGLETRAVPGSRLGLEKSAQENLPGSEGYASRSELRQSTEAGGGRVAMKLYRDLSADEKAVLLEWTREINRFADAWRWDGVRDDALIAYINGKPAGIQAFHQLGIGPVVTAEGLFVEEEFRRTGLRLASRIRTEVLREIQRRGVKMFETLVSPAPEAQAFHEAWIQDMGPAVFEVTYRRNALAYISVDVDLAVEWLQRSPEEREAYILAGFHPGDFAEFQNKDRRSELRSESSSRENLPEITFVTAVAGGLSTSEKAALDTEIQSWNHFSERHRWNGKDRDALIVYVNGKPAGAQAYKMQKRYRTASAEGLFIAPEFRRKGLRLAYRLREAWMRQLIAQNIATVFIPVAEGVEAQGFHKAWAESLGPAVEVLSVDHEDPAQPIRWLGVDLRKLPSLMALEDSPPKLVGLDELLGQRSELRSLPEFEETPFRDYFTLRLSRAIELTPEEIVTYFGEEAYEKAAAEDRRFYIRMMQPADQAFLDDWQEEYESDAEWKGREDWPLDWRHELPQFLDLPELSAGLFSYREGEEKLEGYVSAAVTKGVNEYDPDRPAYGLAISQIEVYYRNIGSEGLLKGVPDALMDFLIKIALEPESGINDGLSMTSTSPGSDALAERYGMEIVEGRERFLSLESLAKRSAVNSLSRMFNTVAVPEETESLEEKRAGLRSLDSLLPYFLHEEIVLTRAEVELYFGREAAARAAREGITYYLKKLSPHSDLHHLRRWAALYDKDEEWKARWKDRLGPHDTTPHFSRFTDPAFGLMSVRDGHENLEGFIGLESRIRDFDEDALVWTTYVHITQMETFYRNRGREGDLRGVSDVLMDFLMKMIVDPSSTIRHGLGLTAMTEGSFGLAERYKMSAGEGGEMYLTQEAVLERAKLRGLDDLFNSRRRSELRFRDDLEKLPGTGRVEGFYEFFDFMRQANLAVRDSGGISTAAVFEDLRYDLSRKTARYTLMHDLTFEVLRRMRRYEQTRPIFSYEVTGAPGQKKLVIAKTGIVPGRAVNLPFEDPSLIAEKPFDEAAWAKTQSTLSSYRLLLESMITPLKDGPRTLVPDDRFTRTWKELLEGWESLGANQDIREGMAWKAGRSLLAEISDREGETMHAETLGWALRFLINETYKAARHSTGLNRQALLAPRNDGPLRVAQVSGQVIGARVFDGLQVTEFASSEELYDYLFEAGKAPWRDINREFDWIVVNDYVPPAGSASAVPSLDAEEAVLQLRQNGYSGPVTVLMTYPYDAFDRTAIFGRTEPGLADYRVQPQVYRRHAVWENMTVLRHEFDSLRSANVRVALPRLTKALQEGRPVDAGQLLSPALAESLSSTVPSDVSLNTLSALPTVPPASTKELLTSLFQPRLARGESLRLLDLASSGTFLRDLWTADPSMSEIASDSLALDESTLRRFKPDAVEPDEAFEIIQEGIASRIVRERHPELKSQVIFLNAPYLDHQEIAETMADEAAHLADPQGSVILVRLHEVDWQYKDKFESEMARWGFKLVKTFDYAPGDYPFTQYIRGDGDTDHMLYVFARVPDDPAGTRVRSELRTEEASPDGARQLNPFQFAFIAALSALQQQTFPVEARAEETRDGLFLPTDPFMAAEILKEVLTGGETLIDLGSGSGVVVFTAAALGARRAVGFESDPGVFKMSRYLLEKLSSDPRLLIAFNPAKVDLRKSNFMRANLAAAGDREDPSKNVYYYFDLGSAAQVFEKEKFLAKLRRLPAGSRLVIHFRQSLEDEDLDFLTLEKKIDHGTLSTYVYRVPPAKEPRVSRQPSSDKSGSRSELRNVPETLSDQPVNRAEALFERWSRNSFGIFGALALYAHQFEFQPGDPVLSVGTGADPFLAIPLAMRGAAVESISLDPRFQENEASFVKTYTSEIAEAGGSYKLHPAGNYLNFTVKPDSKKIVMFFNVLDDPLTQNQDRLIERFLTDVENGGLLIGSVIVPDYYLKAVEQIRSAAAARGYQADNVNIFVPRGAGGSAMPFVFRILKTPADRPSAPKTVLRPLSYSRLDDNSSRYSGAGSVRSVRSELRDSEAVERQRQYYRDVRAWMLSPEDRLLDARDQADFLSVLLQRPVYSELAGLLPAEAEQLLPRSARPSALYQEQLAASAAGEGRVLLDGSWLMEWGRSNPRGLFLLLNALSSLSAESGGPRAAVTGDEHLFEQLSRALLQKDNGLSAEENVRARELAEGGRLASVLERILEDQVETYTARHQNGVAGLHAGSAVFETLGANFVLDSGPAVHKNDELAAALLLPALFKAASLIRGIGEVTAQRNLLTGKLQEILPGGTFTGGTIAIRLREFITQSVIANRLIETAA